MNEKIFRFAVPVAYAAMVAVNFLANALPIGGRDTGVISDSYPNLFAPAGYTFFIWGFIYLLLGAYAVYQWTAKDNPLTAKVNRIFIVNALLNMAWIFAWHYDVIWLSALIMLGLLATLIRIADMLRLAPLTGKEEWLVRLPFSVYFGWITVATIANVTIFLVSLGWNGFGLPQSVWTVIMLIAGAVIGYWRTWRDRYSPYILVLAWAYAGIMQKHISAEGWGGRYPIVIWTAGLAIAAFVAMAALIWLKKAGTAETRPLQPQA